MGMKLNRFVLDLLTTRKELLRTYLCLAIIHYGRFMKVLSQNHYIAEIKQVSERFVTDLA